ncbi:MAG: nucleotidyltransferase [Phycisphaerales bacterium]|jgi:hypothetical protein
MKISIERPDPGTLNDMLNRIVERIQLTDTQHNRATKVYEKVGRWLDETDSELEPYEPRIYPQGSMLLQTTVRPMGEDGEAAEYDIDLVCQLNVDADATHANTLYNRIRDRLVLHDEYGDLVEEKGRCLRLGFEDDRMHLDVIPAAPDDRAQSATGILIPDKRTWTQRKLPRDTYKETDPTGFAEWFDAQCVVREATGRSMAQASMDPAPHREPVYAKAPLRKIVQLIKHRRNQEFLGEKEMPSSILITTMAARAYRGQADLGVGLVDVLGAMDHDIKSAHPHRVAVPNPTNEDEDFADAMSDECYDRFSRMISDMRWEVVDAAGSGTQRLSIEPKLAKFAGQGVVAKAYNDLMSELNEARDDGRLVVGGGGALSIGSGASASGHGRRVRDNTFHSNG